MSHGPIRKEGNGTRRIRQYTRRTKKKIHALLREPIEKKELSHRPIRWMKFATSNCPTQ